MDHNSEPGQIRPKRLETHRHLHSGFTVNTNSRGQPVATAEVSVRVPNPPQIRRVEIMDHDTISRHSHHDRLVRRRRQSIVIYELKICGFGAIGVNLLWWITVYAMGLKFPFMHFLLCFFALALFPTWDRKFYGNDHSTQTELLRFGINLLVFIVGMILIGPLGGTQMLTTDPPAGLAAYVLSVVAICAMLAIARGASNLVVFVDSLFQ